MFLEKVQNESMFLLQMNLRKTPSQDRKNKADSLRKMEAFGFIEANEQELKKLTPMEVKGRKTESTPGRREVETTISKNSQVL